MVGQPSVENVHSPEENHVSRVSESCIQPSPSGASMSQYTSSSLYQTGIWCPYHICLLMHQSRRFSIQWVYTFSNRSGRMLMSLFSTTESMSFLRVTSSPF